MVVLDELPLGRDPHLGVPSAPVGLREEAPLVGMNGGFDHDQAGETDRKRAHGGGGYRR
jgi:hypothetical protein